jgi:hypothetical protein
MPIGIWNLEWLNHNSQRSYPLAEDATKTDSTGTFQLPDDFLLGLYLPIHAGLDVDPSQFFISSVSVFATGYSVSISYNDDSGSATVVATAVISKAAHTPNMSYALPGVSAFDDTVGKIVIGILDSIDQQPAGQFSFRYQDGKLDSDCIRPMIRGIQSIRILNNGELSTPITGHVIFEAGSNMQITVSQVPGLAAEVRFDAIEGKGLTETCACEEPTAGPIMTINGIGPDPYGNFQLNGKVCIEIDPITHGLQLTDTCSSACCGCSELESLTKELELLGTAEQTLENFLSQLSAQVNAFSQLVLGSKISDAGCIQC